jgi:Zn-dependent peptidase ImmA (M78 family)
MNKKNININDGNDHTKLLANLRELAPSRPLRLHEHWSIAERQATRLHEVLGETGPAAQLDWLAGNKVPGLIVVLQPRWKMEGLSGMTTWTPNEGWVIGINKGNIHTRRRFTLAHEFKHVLDANHDKITYRGLDDKRELIANYFAACYLMPKLWLRRAWTGGLQDPEALAGLFNVSLDAMRRRLRYLGYLEDEPKRVTTTYFRASLSDLRAAG